IPSVRLHSSVGLAALLALKQTELLHPFHELLGHGHGPPARATTTFSPGSSIGRHEPAVKGDGPRARLDDERVPMARGRGGARPATRRGQWRSWWVEIARSTDGAISSMSQ